MRNVNCKLFLTTFIIVAFLSSCKSTDEITGKNQLFIPQLIDTANGEVVNLNLKKGKHEFYSGVESDTMGINGNYLGPTVRLHRGRTATIQFNNNIGENTSVHGHGLHVAGDIDGGPQQIIKPGTTWEIDIPVVQEAGISWYHPHFMGKTAEHVHAGLAGIYLIEDENSGSLGLPNTYGLNDIPLIIQDRLFTDGKMNPYKATLAQMEEGLRGETLVVNGTISAYHTVPKGWVRLRLLNGANASFYRFHFSGDVTFFKIATEGGFLNKPIPLKELVMAPGERNEIMIDMSDLEKINFMAEFLPADPEDQSFFIPNKKASVVELRTDASLPTEGTLPEELNNIQYFTKSDQAQAVARNIHLEMGDGNDEVSMQNMHNMFSINGRSMDMQRIDERVNKGDLELWRITAEMMPHPFHIHGVSFLIITHNGNPPAEADRGWKDTVVVTEEPTEVMMRFNYLADEKTPYMYHCHILEHEDGGMMGQFTVQ